mmetsp:Transcript_15083/g.44011  ORF Transcript_15083/g.44011 Transcript_15083/m.44011 type:complete len:97 (-) Transcript_15083:103-393(-)
MLPSPDVPLEQPVIARRRDKGALKGRADMLPLARVALLPKVHPLLALLGSCCSGVPGQPSVTRGVGSSEPDERLRRTEGARLLTVNALRCETSVRA